MQNRGEEMGSKTDQVKGRVKEAAGALTGDKDLQREGKIERVGGEIKEKAGEMADAIEKTAKKTVDKVKAAVKRST